MYIHNLNPVLFDFGIIEIRWYSLAYIFGILIGWWLGKKIFKYRINIKNKVFDLKNFDDLISYLIIAIILGGRLGYVLFYNFSYYLKNPIDILKIWEGGMSFHGALIGVIISIIYFSKDKKIEKFFIYDAIACVTPIGLFFGRVANFINSELYGIPSNVYWSVIFLKVDNIPRHPSQLYEAFLEGILLFIILMIFIYNKKIKNGFCSSLFLILYGTFRIFCEQFREPDEQIGYLFNLFSLGTVLSFIMIVAGIIVLTKIKSNE